MEGRKLAGFMLMELWMEEEENKRKAEEFKVRRRVDWRFFVGEVVEGRGCGSGNFLQQVRQQPVWRWQWRGLVMS